MFVGIQSDADRRRTGVRAGLRRDRRNGLGVVMRSVAAALIVAGATTGIALSPAAAAPRLTPSSAASAPAFKFSAEPYTAKGAQQRSDFSYELQPGHKILDQIVVKNTSPADESFLLYGEDATNVPRTGTYAFDQRSQMHNTTVGQWLTIGATHLTVPTGKQAVVTFQLSIPDNAPPGDHVGGVVVEELKAPAQQQQPVGVNVVLRDVVPMYVRVVGQAYPGLTVENLTVYHQSPTFPYISGTKAAVSFVLVNTGNDILDPQSVTVSITGAVSGTIHKYTIRQTGGPQGRANPLPLQMLPGAKLSLTEEWSGIPPFDPLTGHVSANAIDSSTTAKVSTVASTTFWYFPWILVVIVLVLAAGLIALIVIRRRRRTAAGGTPSGQEGGPGSSGPFRPPSMASGAQLKKAGI